MLSLRRETEYAVQFLRELKRSKEGLSLKEVSNRTGASFLFLQKIARKLRRAKIVEAEKGASGGYHLIVPASKINLKQITLIIEDSLCNLLPCCGAQFKCTKEKGCALKGKVGKINSTMIKMMEKIKLSDL